MKHLLVLTCITCLWTSTLANADDAFTVHARVLRVEPLTEVAHTRSVDPNCLKPPKNAGLAAILAWDLGLGDCARREQVTSVTGYRVHYEWNDRVYSNVMNTRPEDYIAIKVRVD